MNGNSKNEEERNARIVRRKGKAALDEILVIADRVSAYVKGPFADHPEILYDENGIPK